MANDEQNVNEELVDFFDVLEEVEDRNDPPAELDTEEENTEPPAQETEETDGQETSTDDNQETEGKSEGEGEQEGAEELSVIDSIKQAFGYSDIEGEFEDSEEGLVEFTKQAAYRMAEGFVDEQFQSHPIMQQFFEYVSEGGDPTHFLQVQFPETNYGSLQFEEDNIELQEKLVKDELVASGYSGEDLKAELADIKNGGILESKARRALARLKARQQEGKETLIEQQRQERQRQQEEATKYWQEVKTEIQGSNDFNGFRIPEADKNPFYEFMVKPVKDGKTLRDQRLENLALKDTLTIDYLLFKNFDISGLVQRKANDLQVKSLRDRLKKAKLDKRGDSGRGNNASAGDEELGTL